MPNINNEIYSYSACISKAEVYEISDTENKKEAKPLAEALISVRNSDDGLNKNGGVARITAYLHQPCQWLRTTSGGHIFEVNGSDKAETELQVILAEGENLRRQVDLLRAPETEVDVSHGGRANILKSLLIGIGLIGTSGYAGYRFCSTTRHTGSQQSTSPPSYFSPDVVKTGGSHGETLFHSYRNKSLYHDGPANRTRPRRGAQSKDASSVPVKTGHSDVKKIEPGKKCYEYYGKGRLTGKKPVSCADEVKASIRESEPLPYIYTRHQPRECKTQKLEQKCQKAHQNYHKKHNGKKLERLELNVGKTPCLCPPPVGEHVRLVSPHIKRVGAVSSQGNKPAGKVPVIALPLSTAISGTGKNRLTPSTEMPASEVASWNTEDDVKIEKMYDFSCVDARESMSWADILRQVGETLKSPVESLARESQIVHYHNTLEMGCPGQNESRHLQKYTGKVDAILSGVLQFIPEANPVMVLQTIVGPVLEMYADELDGKPFNPEKLNVVNQQIIFLSRHEIKTLSPKEKMQLFSDHTETKLIKKFDTINGEVAVKIGEKKHLLHNDLYDFPYIEQNGVICYIHFNSKDKIWMFNGDYDLRASSALSSLKIETYKSNFSYNNAKDVIITSDEEIVDTKSNKKYILINGTEVQVINGIEKESFFPANGVGSGDLIKKDAGEYYFETGSAPVDDEVAEILNMDVVEFISGGDKTSIKSDLLSYDINKLRYLKYRNLYHPLMGGDVYIECIDGSLAMITKKAGRLSVNGFLKQNLHGTEFLDGGLFITRDLKIRIEQDGEVLINNDFQTRDGIKSCINYEGNYLQINGKAYKATDSKYSQWILIKHKKEGEPDIPVFLYDDVLLEGRDDFIDDTPSSGNCRARRNPGNSGICKTSLSSETVKILKSLRPEVVSTELTPANDFPGLYVDRKNKKLYLKMKGGYFMCKYVASDINGKFQNGVLKLQKKVGYGVLSKTKTVAKLTYHDQGGVRRVKTIDEEIERIAKINLRDVKKITHGRHNRQAELSETLKKIRSMDKLNPPPAFRMYVNTDKSKPNIKEAIGRAFFSGNKNWSQTELSKVGDEGDFRLRLSAKRLKLSKNHAIKVLNSAKHELNNLTVNTVIYLKSVLGTTNDKLIADFARLLSSRLDKTHSALERSKLILCFSDVSYDQPIAEYDPVRDADFPGGEWEEVHWKPNYDEHGLKRMAMAFTYAKGDEIYVNIDRLGGIDPTSSTNYLRKPYSIEPFLTLIHEASHKNDLAKDLMYIPIENNEYIPVLDAMDELADSFSKMEFHNPELLRPLLSDYFRTAKPYRNISQNDLFESKNLSFIFRYDPGFRASILLNTPDFLAKLASDIDMNKFVKI